MIVGLESQKATTNMTNLNIPLIAATISFVGLIATLLKMLSEQRKYHQIKYNQDKRLEYKLRIHEILVSNIMDYDMIISKLQAQTPTVVIDSIEIRKCIYEMLTESTIVSFDDGSFTVDVVESDNEDEDDE